jgi:ABC-type branched-subunit amino acid transport system permease subunit
MYIIGWLALIGGTSALYAAFAMSAAIARSYSRAISLAQAGIFCAGAAATAMLAQLKASFAFGLIGVLIVALMVTLATFIALADLRGSGRLRETLAGLGLSVYLGGAAATIAAASGVDLLDAWPRLENSWFSAAAPAQYRRLVFGLEALLLLIIGYVAFRWLKHWTPAGRISVYLVFLAGVLSALSGSLLVTWLSEVNPTAQMVLVGLIATALVGRRTPLLAAGIGFLIGLSDFALRNTEPQFLRHAAPALVFMSIAIIQTRMSQRPAPCNSPMQAPPLFHKASLRLLAALLISAALLALLPLNLPWPNSLGVVELGIAAVGIQLFYAATGRLNLMQTVFVMIGAYAIVLGPTMGAPQGLALLGGLAASAAFAILLGLILKRSRSDAFALFTLAAAVLAIEIIARAGPDGMPLEMLAPKPTFLTDLPFLSEFEPMAALYWLASAVLISGIIISMLLPGALRRTALAGSQGFLSKNAFVLCFALSALYGAAAGALVAWWMIYASTIMFDFRAGLDMLAATLVAGAGSPVGTIVGAIVVQFFHTLISSKDLLSLGTIEMASGAVIAGTAVLAPGGLLPSLVASAGALCRKMISAGSEAALRAAETTVAKAKHTIASGRAQTAATHCDPAHAQIVTLDPILRAKYTLNLILDIARAAVAILAAVGLAIFIFGGFLRVAGAMALARSFLGEIPLLQFIAPLILVSILTLWIVVPLLILWLIERVNSDSVSALLFAMSLCIIAMWVGGSRGSAVVLFGSLFYLVALAAFGFFLLRTLRTPIGAALREPAPSGRSAASRINRMQLVVGLAVPARRFLAVSAIATAIWLLVMPLDFILKGITLWVVIGISFAKRKMVANRLREDVRLVLARARRTAGQLLARDRRRPILFLRSFSDDYIETVNVTARVASAVFGADYRRLRLEECIASSIGRAGPVIAIARPGSPTIELGAAREAFMDHEWQDAVAKYMNEAQLIVMVHGATKGLHWEVDQIMQRGYRHKLILVNPRPDTVGANELVAFVNGRHEVTGHPIAQSSAKVLAVMAGTDADMPVLIETNLRADAIAYRAALRYCINARPRVD